MMLLACAAAEPHIYKQDEFDRQSADFNKEPADRDAVTVCYNGWTATPEQVAARAQQECARYDKAAYLRDRGYGECPLFTPTEARFDCRLR